MSRLFGEHDLYLWMRGLLCCIFGHRFDTRGDLMKKCLRCGKWSPRT